MFLDPTSWAIRKTPWGRGVFARREVPAGTVVGDYVGLVDVPRDEPVGQLYAMMLSLYRWVYPPSPRRTVGVHVINHSCAPNAGLYPFRGHVLATTIRRVFAGEELTFDYWMTKPEPGEDWHPCFCGTAQCRGSFALGSARQEELVRRLFVGPSWAGARRKIRPGETLQPLPRYPSRTRDLSAYNVFGHPRLPPVRHHAARLEHRPLRALLRESGRRVELPKLGVVVLGSHDGQLLVDARGPRRSV